ncbi:MAG: DUF2240 family protein [Candidatus Aenigmatarchaeota archaeon]
MLQFEKILEILEKKSGLNKKDLEKKIEEKQKELSGLLSREGAAYLVAKDLGIELKETSFLEIKDLVSGMKRINLIGRIFKISEIHEFEKKDGSRGKVINIFIADPTGFVKLPLWDDKTELIGDEIKLGDVVKIRNCFARENIFGDVEISLGKYGIIEKAEKDYGLPSVQEMEKKFLGALPKRKEIKDLEEGIYEIKGTLVQIFQGKYIFPICPVCKNSLKENKCEEHGEVKPEYALVISGIIDDGSDNIRVVFFRENAEKILGLKASELEKISEEERENLIKEKILGLELVLKGKVKKNKIFERLEFVVNEVKDLDIKEESKKLIEELKSPLE